MTPIPYTLQEFCSEGSSLPPSSLSTSFGPTNSPLLKNVNLRSSYPSNNSQPVTSVHSSTTTPEKEVPLVKSFSERELGNNEGESFEEVHKRNSQKLTKHWSESKKLLSSVIPSSPVTSSTPGSHSVAPSSPSSTRPQSSSPRSKEPLDMSGEGESNFPKSANLKNLSSRFRSESIRQFGLGRKERKSQKGLTPREVSTDQMDMDFFCSSLANGIDQQDVLNFNPTAVSRFPSTRNPTLSFSVPMKDQEKSGVPVNTGKGEIILCELTFTPVSGVYVLGILYKGEQISNSPITLTTATGMIAKVVGITSGERLLASHPITCAFELLNIAPKHVHVQVAFSDGGYVTRKIEATDHGYEVNFMAPSEGSAIINCTMRQTREHIVGSPYSIPKIEPALWLKAEFSTSRAEMGQQFHFRLKSSYNTLKEDITVLIMDINNSSWLPSYLSLGVAENVEEEDSQEENERQPKHWDCYFKCDVLTKLSVSISLLGRHIDGMPFEVETFPENALYTKIRHLNTIVDNAISINQQNGIKLVCNWQTKSSRDIRLAFSCCLLSDLGEIEEIVYEGCRRSSSGAIEFAKWSRARYNERSIFLRPETLREDISCIPIVLSCLNGNFSSIKKLIFTFYENDAKIGPHYLCDPCPTPNPSFLFGLVARDEKKGTWYIETTATYNPGQFILECLPYIRFSILKYSPLKNIPSPIPLQIARPTAFNSKLSLLQFDNVLSWSSTPPAITMVALICSWKKRFKYSVEVGGSRGGVTIPSLEKISLQMQNIPVYCQTIFLLLFPVDPLDMLCFANLESYSTRITIDDTTEISGKRILANFKGFSDEMGEMRGSIVQGKFSRRSIVASWEYTPMVRGLKGTALKDFVSDKNEIRSFLSPYWYPKKTNHIRIIAIKAKGFSVPKKFYLEFKVKDASKKGMTIEPQKTQVTLQTKEPHWGDAFLIRSIDTCKQPVKVHVLCWSKSNLEKVELIGTTKFNALKYYQRSLSNGRRCIDDWFVLKNKDSKETLLHFRFLAI
eukprot:TRINITY_DN8282_c0_g1_i5.p1 TRINITY_DN8282_c0_g1~~TRINITY_DN8282_c0_g1_i5.p1  ORF type:complete len:1077 (+),score=206.83 TRINITY_DN8282_c0_g1_i5:184-3231(+)